MIAQLPLLIDLPERAQFAEFIEGNNALALAVCKKMASVSQADDMNQAYLWGVSGAGKSHLLQASIALARAQNWGDCRYIALNNIDHYHPSLLEGEPQMLAVDDLQNLAGKDEWQLALLNAINRARDSGGKILLAAKQAPAELAISLMDLRSRLGWGTVFRLRELDDAGKLAWLQARARKQGYELSMEAGQYLLNHSRRDMQSLQQNFVKLNSASIAQKRKVSIPLIRQVLELN